MNQLPNQQPTLRVHAALKDSNPSGNMFGGWLMGQMDIAGAIPAVTHSKGLVFTVAVKNMVFLAPLYPNDIVSFYAEIIGTGQTSMTVNIDCWVQRNAEAPECFKASQAEIVYVAVDKNGHKRII